MSASQIGDEDPDFAGRLLCAMQKYLHDMASWEALSVTEQERVIGRTKLEDIELDDDVKRPIHVALNVIEDADGNELKILRGTTCRSARSARASTAPLHRLLRTPAVTERMLENMFIGDPPGNTDRILEFSTALTGSLFFTPIVDFLNNPPPLPGTETATDPRHRRPLPTAHWQSAA